jgi:hypothetical protein
MKTSTLRDHLAEYYRDHRLPPAALARLQALVDERSPSQPSARGVKAGRAWTRRSAVLAGAGALAVASLALVVVLVRFPGAGPRNVRDLSQAIGREIALNHAKDLAPEFSATDYEGLRAAMEKLDFVLVEPARAEAGRLHVRGARYCSIQGRLAAQIRLEDDLGRHYTLYETSLDEALRGVPERELEISGARILLWQEAGLLFGLACPADLEPSRGAGTERTER